MVINRGEGKFWCETNIFDLMRMLKNVTEYHIVCHAGYQGPYQAGVEKCTTGKERFSQARNLSETTLKIYYKTKTKSGK